MARRKKTTRASRATRARRAAATPRAAADPGEIRAAIASKRFLAADRAALDLREIATWDKYLLREHRLLVPIDVQALYVPPGSTEALVRLPLLVAGPNGQAVTDPEKGMPPPFDPGSPREPGVHLHWAMPDALLRGSFGQAADGSPNRLGLPALPDRWVVLRIALPRVGSAPAVAGWVLEADRAVAVPLAQWTEGGSASQNATPAGLLLERQQLTGTVGGAVSWSGVYDAVLNRFAFHDPLADLPGSVDEDCAAYVVAGWWSDPALDPLDKARSNDSLHELLERLRWRLLAEWGDAAPAQQRQQSQAALRKSLGLTMSDRWSDPRPITAKDRARGAAGASDAPFVPIDKTVVAKLEHVAVSAFASDAVERFVAPAWHLRSSLLHGAVYGVPVRGTAVADRRPSAQNVAVALGLHDDDLIAAFAAAQAPTDERRATERLLAAFTAQKVNRLGSADGAVELEEHEHATGFASLPSESAGTDRYLQRVRLIAKVPTIAAFIFRHSRGLPYVLPRNDLDYIGNFVNMTFEIGGRHEPNAVLQRALEILLVLHADHEQNCSTSAVRGVGSSHVDPFSAVSAGIAALYGPLHGGANEAVLRMLDQIGAKENVPAFIEQVKDGKGRLMGFGHRVYKSYDPRAKLIKRVADDVFEQTGLNPKLEIALELERIALEDEYFVSRKLYPNVDFYSGLIYQAMGYPTDYFTVLFALGRLPGWIAQWEEMLTDPEQKIARPRQIYTGYDRRDYVPIEKRH
jgi:citrate synthase